MKDNENNGKKAFSDFLHKASDVTQKIAKEAYEGSKDVAKKIKENSDERRKERLDPITQEDYNSETFHIPNIILSLPFIIYLLLLLLLLLLFFFSP